MQLKIRINSYKALSNFAIAKFNIQAAEHIYVQCNFLNDISIIYFKALERNIMCACVPKCDRLWPAGAKPNEFYGRTPNSSLNYDNKHSS